MQQGLLKRVHPWCRTGTTELKFEPGKSAAADIQRLQLKRHKPQPRTVTGASAKEGGRKLSSRTPKNQGGGLLLLRASSPNPLQVSGATSESDLCPRTPPRDPSSLPPQVPPPGTVSRGDGLDLHAHHGPTGPASRGVFAAAPTPAPLRPDPAGAPAPLLAATAEPEEVRLESGPARGGAAGKGAAGWSRATRWGRLGRGPGEATLTWLLRSLARLTTINPLAERGGW